MTNGDYCDDDDDDDKFQKTYRFTNVLSLLKHQITPTMELSKQHPFLSQVALLIPGQPQSTRLAGAIAHRSNKP